MVDFKEVGVIVMVVDVIFSEKVLVEKVKEVV